jgi:hypothetical protein
MAVAQPKTGGTSTKKGGGEKAQVPPPHLKERAHLICVF